MQNGLVPDNPKLALHPAGRQLSHTAWEAGGVVGLPGTSWVGVVEIGRRMAQWGRGRCTALPPGLTGDAPT